MVRRFEGVADVDEVSELRLREDLRTLPQKLRDWWLTPDGQTTTFFLTLGLGIVLIWMPFGGEFTVLLLFLFTKTLLGYRKKKWDFPFRVPESAGLIDGSTNRKGRGIIHLGSDVKTEMPAFISDNDARTHALLFGTTGSGKTELLLAWVVNSLIYDGGASYTDGKGDVKLWLKFMNMTRMLGREDDLLLLSFITSGHEFYDKQESRISNTMNMYATGSSGMCTEASISLMDSSSGGGDMWKGRAIAFLGALIRPMVFLRDKGVLLLDADTIREYFDLPVLERFVWDEEDTWKGGIKREQGYFSKTFGKVWDRVIRPLRAFMVTIPGYDKSRLGAQEQKTLEQHGYITMQLARLFGDLADNYGHIMQTPLGEVEMFDVVINDRILVTLLPALERSPESLGMLGKIIVGGIKQMAAGCLGNKVDGLRREIVDARPTNSPVPFPTIFDEYGYYAVLGFASMPAQARSLGFSVIFAAQDFASLKKSSPEEADQTWENTNLRGMGRITSGGDSETYKRMAALGGTVRVARLAGYERVIGAFRTRLRAQEHVQIEERPRVNSDDLHSQADGEFHLFMGKKEDQAQRGRVRVVRVNAFYTDVTPIKPDKRTQPAVRELGINHFARVSPPPLIVDPRGDPSIYGEKGFIEALKAGTVPVTVKSNESKSPLISGLKLMAQRNAALEASQQFRPLDLGFTFLAYADHHKTRRDAELYSYVQAAGQSAAVRAGSAGADSKVLEQKLVPGALPAALPVGKPMAAPAVRADEVAPPAAPDTAAAPATAVVAPPVASAPLPRPVATDATPAPAAARADQEGATGAGDAVVALSEEQKETLAKLSLFTNGDIAVPINTATEQQLVDLAEAMLATGDVVFGGLSAEDAAQEAMDAPDGQLHGQVAGLDKGAVVSAIMATKPTVSSPEADAREREAGRKFVDKMALGTVYLETPVPQEHFTSASFLEAVEALNESVMRPNGS